MLLRNFIIYCLVMGLFTAIFSKLVIDFRLESTPGTSQMLLSPSSYLVR